MNFGKILVLFYAYFSPDKKFNTLLIDVVCCLIWSIRNNITLKSMCLNYRWGLSSLCVLLLNTGPDFMEMWILNGFELAMRD
jgi:hypothetical protein